MRHFALLAFLSLQGCTVMGVAYDAATSVAVRYCALSPAQRAATQLIVAGKAYDSGICTVLADGDAVIEWKAAL